MKLGLSKWKYIEDSNMETVFSPRIYEPDDFTYVSAHCIHKGYFRQYKSIIAEEFKLKEKIKISQELNNILKNKNTVSLHIRLTDYFNHPGWICNQNYYDRAIEYFQGKIEKPYFIIFTDDADRARKMFRFADNVYWISDEHYRDYEELTIMSMCKHNIIAQSTFSYWGAWLNPNPDKIVIAPKEWLRGRVQERDWLAF
jgi:hypothetical protein